MKQELEATLEQQSKLESFQRKGPVLELELEELEFEFGSLKLSLKQRDQLEVELEVEQFAKGSYSCFQTSSTEVEAEHFEQVQESKQEYQRCRQGFPASMLEQLLQVVKEERDLMEPSSYFSSLSQAFQQLCSSSSYTC